MTTFNTMAVSGTLQSSPIAAVWAPVQETNQSLRSTLISTVLSSTQARIQFQDGYTDGEQFGFSSQREETMDPIQIGETDDKKKTISFRIYNTAGQPASGITGEGDICTPVGAQLQTNRDLAGYVNALGAFTHVGDGVYTYTFTNASVASAGGEGNILLRVKVPGFRTVVLRVPLRDLPPAATSVRDAVLNAARSGFVGTGTIGEGIAIAASLLQGNYYMDNITNTDNGQTAARIRCFHTGAAAGAATQGGSGEGEFATFLVTTSYVGPNKVQEHRVVQQ